MTVDGAGASLQLQLRSVDERSAQIVWLEPRTNSDWCYKVLLDLLTSNASALREGLQRYLRDYAALDRGEAVRAGRATLLRAGRDLYESLFASEDPRAAMARQAYEERDAAGPLHLSIKVDPALTFPWTLVVPARESESVDDADFTGDDRRFWCMRHDLSVSTFGVAGGRPPIGIDECRTLSLLNRPVYDKVHKSLTDPAEQRRLAALLNESAPDVNFQSEPFQNAIVEAAKQPGVRLRFAYLFGHANGESFEFSADDKLSASRLAVRLHAHRSGATSQQTLLFLNGCETSGEGDAFTFGKMMGQFTVAALVGTEVKVPDRFAFRFALAYLHRVLREGSPIREALDALRREHLPLSLAYSLYAADGLQIVASEPPRQGAATDEDRGRPVNYSKQAVKCTT